MKLNKCIKKVCCFYASDWHLTVMLLPYISKKIKENNKVYMRFENSIEENFNALLNKLDLKNKEDIESISWNQNINEEEPCEKDKIYIISGNEEYIKQKNNSIEQYYRNKDDNIKIINCFEVDKIGNLNDIISKYRYTSILNTNGESNIA